MSGMDQRDIEIFEDQLGDDRIGFRFVGPSHAFSSENVHVEFAYGHWRLTDEDYAITVDDEYKMAALLKIVARRCGFEAELRLMED